MNKTKQDITIAQHCNVDAYYSKHYSRPIWVWPNGTETHNATSDLNAMHEAEKILDQETFYAYAALLVGEAPWIEAVGAPADQRAEAFLKTLGLWEDEA